MDRDAWYFPRTDLAQAVLRDIDRLHTRRLVLIAERHTGKTSFLWHDLTPLAWERGYVPVYIDVWGARHDPGAGIAEQMRIAAASLEPPGGPGERADLKTAAARIEYWASRLARAAGEKTILLMIDEVQALDAHGDGVGVALAIRAVLDDRAGRFAVVFASSNRDRFARLFGGGRAPFHELGDEIGLPDFDGRFIDHLITQFGARSGGKMLDRERLVMVFRTLGSKPGDMVSLLRKMLTAGEGDLIGAMSAVLADIRAARDPRGTLPRLDRLVMAALADGIPPFSRRALSDYSAELRFRITPSTVQRSLERLRNREVIIQGGRGFYKISEVSALPAPPSPRASRLPRSSFQTDLALQNNLLRALPAADWNRLRAHFSPIEMSPGKTLFEPSSRLDHAYFPATSIISLQHLAADGTSTKIATIGPEGVVGITLIMAGGAMNHQALVQGEGLLYRVKGALLKEEFARGGAMQRLLLRYAQALLTHIAQMAVCNRRHTIDQQLCGWLLASLDRLKCAELTMTHELLANTLGVRREGITEAAHKLQRAGLISYRRGHIRVIDRGGVEARCCECYGIVRREYDQLFPGMYRDTLRGSVPLAAANESDAHRNSVKRAAPTE